jgi:hypothetical protein
MAVSADQDTAGTGLPAWIRDDEHGFYKTDNIMAEVGPADSPTCVCGHAAHSDSNCDGGCGCTIYQPDVGPGWVPVYYIVGSLRWPSYP